MIINAGAVCKFVGNSNGFFRHGDLVVALETDDCPYCVAKADYHGPMEERDYKSYEYEAVPWDDLEVLYDDRSE